MNHSTNRAKTRKIAFLGMFFALAMAFSYLESMVAVPGLPPGIKLGLANVVTMYCLFFLGAKPAYLLTAMKALFVGLTRGPVAAVLSLSGGVCSVTLLIFCKRITKNKLSYITLSILGAVAHNIGQLAAARWITSVFLYYYIPVLLVAGVVVGTMTGIVFTLLVPYLKKIQS